MLKNPHLQYHKFISKAESPIIVAGKYCTFLVKSTQYVSVKAYKKLYLLTLEVVANKWEVEASLLLRCVKASVQ